MPLRRATAAMLVTVASWAQVQTGDIYQRVRQAAGEQAAQALASKDYRRAEQIVAQTNVPDVAGRAELLALRGALDFLQGKMDDALSCFKGAQKLQPLRQSDRFTEAMALVQLGRDADARDTLTSLAEAQPGAALYLYWLGRIDYDQRRYDEAVRKLTKASEIAPESERVWDSLGLAFDMQGMIEQAGAAFNKAVELNRKQSHPSAWPPHNLGYLLLRTNQLAEAESAFRESLRYDDGLAQAHYHLGRVLEKESRDADAIEQYRRAIALDRSSSDACYSLAMLYRRLKREAEARAMFAEYRQRRNAGTMPGPRPEGGAQ